MSAAIHEHGWRKFPAAGLLASSETRQWTGVAAEVRSHPSGDLPAFRPQQTEVTLTMTGDGTGVVRRNGNGRRQETAVTPSTIWLCPTGIFEDSISMSRPIERVAHVYLTNDAFIQLGRDSRASAVRPDSVDYIAGLDDPLVEMTVRAIVEELECETASGTVLVESLALSLAARLACSYGTGDVRLTRLPGGMDSVRLRRVLDYIGDEIETDLSVAALADIACLSRYHFARAFKAAMGVAPHRYVAGRRYQHALNLLATTPLGIAEIAAACRFSSQANFTRAFERAAGTTPGRYRAALGRPVDPPSRP